MLLRKRHHNLPGGRANLVIFSHHENKNCYPQLKYYCDEVVFPVGVTFVLDTLQAYWSNHR